ncbi:hypothetical protein E2C01_026793 [Portunus trituberculatus]|uniref:Uncharacterized protein n=1 Tax=Portunus trituberculatus TaxID=210409 RepID=A0A5B7EH19_PORTR|nr:hypothetical protein [Portunus trituberculatus]
MSLASPKSATFTKWFSPTRQFLAARSLWRDIKLTLRVLTATQMLYLFHTASYTSPYCPPPSLCFMAISVRSISHSSGSVGREEGTTSEICGVVGNTLPV